VYFSRDSGYGSWRSDRSKENNKDPSQGAGVLSNNRRWMLYKINKPSTDELEPPRHQKEQATADKSLTSRIDELSQVKESVKPTATPGRLDPSVQLGSIPGQTESTQRAPGDVTGSVSALKGKLDTSRLTSGLSPNRMGNQQTSPAAPQSDLDSRWKEIEKVACHRPLIINDLDFTDLGELDDVDVLQAPMPQYNGAINGIPQPPGFCPPPPPMGGPPMPPGIPPAPPFGAPMPPGPPMPPMPPGAPTLPATKSSGLKKSDDRQKKTVRLHWKEVQENVIVPNPTPDVSRQGTIWRKIKPTQIDIQKFEHLFETRVTEGKAKVSVAALTLLMLG